MLSSAKYPSASVFSRQRPTCRSERPVADAVDTVVVLEVDGALVTEICLVRNPDKLGHVTL